MAEITDALIERGKSRAGGWSRFQLGLLGIAWPPRHGWRQRVIGKQMSDEAAAAFIAGRTARLPKMKSRPRREKVAAAEAVQIAQLQRGERELDARHLASLRDLGVRNV